MERLSHADAPTTNLLLAREDEPIRGFILDDGRAFIWTVRRMKGHYVSVVAKWNKQKKEYVYEDGSGVKHKDATEAHERAWKLYNEARSKVR